MSVFMDYCSKVDAVFAVKDFQEAGADAFNLICTSKGSTKKKQNFLAMLLFTKDCR